MLTSEEVKVCEDAGELFCAFCKLEIMHPSDMQDVCFHVHAIQAIVMARAAQRAFPNHFPIKNVMGEKRK